MSGGGAGGSRTIIAPTGTIAKIKSGHIGDAVRPGLGDKECARRDRRRAKIIAAAEFDVQLDDVSLGRGPSFGSDEICWLSRQSSLIRCFSIASQAASASSKVLKGEPVILIAPWPS